MREKEKADEREQVNERLLVDRLATGPYEVALHPPQEISSLRGWCIVNAKREIVASVYGGGTQALTDARVLAASFDLLVASEALLEVIGFLPGIETERRAMIVAIKKATEVK